jgi:hypothetical protein
MKSGGFAENQENNARIMPGKSNIAESMGKKVPGSPLVRKWASFFKFRGGEK